MKNKKILGLMLAGMMLANVVPQVSLASNDYNVKRIQGMHRYETAASIADSAFTTSDRAVLVSGNNFADALTAGNLADHAPIFLAEKADMMQRTINTMRSLDVKEVVIIGGEKSVPKSVEERLKRENFKVIRIAGRNRYETSTKLAKQLKAKNKDNVVLANGEKFADALSAAPYAVQKKQTLVLTDGKTLPKDVKAQDVKAIIGGEKSVNIKGLDKVQRISGKDRYETSLEVLKHMNKTQSAVIADGRDYPDALAAAPYAVKKNTGILLSDDTAIDNIKEYVDSQNISDITLIGGEKSITKYQEQKFTKTSTEQKPEEKPEDKPQKPEQPSEPEQPSKPEEKPEENPNELLDVDSPELSAKEKELIKLVNDYREQHGKKRLKVSKSLMKVARTHINDLNMNFDMNNPPVDARGIKGNMHSWSDKGNWTPVIYTDDHKYDKLTKIKPKEIANYNQTGYEVAVNGFMITPQRALEKWKNSPGHNDTILSQNKWSDPTPEEEENGFTGLSNMGVAINGNYACIWFTNNNNGIVDPMGYYEFN
ncbi:cell wall-binding repeat-containing protein [Finegoldia sp. BIOML-A1]|uniref:cell wall-binding repeat-containing protein n=1 Tax=Finegoldia sp. BIOML-A1 TaxID=2584649 RepID=UPI0012B10549|nr:cell wall-binding repeat-containing protein [Finegoldia sp. BIOML-A1]MSB11249.1 N-acetylmuramoyl-L-alanine amidase [Finegoldia sp. BIOML-A1]